MTEIAFTERELDVMAVLWERGEGTVAQVQERLVDTLAYTTVLTVLRTLEEKGHVAHREEGRAYVYRPTVPREAAGASELRRIMGKIFAGSPEALLTQLVSERGVSDRSLERMRRLLDDALDRRDGDARGAPEQGKGAGAGLRESTHGPHDGPHHETHEGKGGGE